MRIRFMSSLQDGVERAESSLGDWLVRWAAVGLSALAFSWCFPPLAWRWLAWVALVPFFLALRGLSARSAALVGFGWAMLMACGITDWLPPAISLYYERPLWLGIALFLGATAVMVAPHFAIFGWVFSKVGTGRGTAWAKAVQATVLACAWVVAEFGRSRLLTGNPWGLLGYSQVGVSMDANSGYGVVALHVVQLADLGGVYLVGFVIVFVNLAVAELIFWGWSRRGTLGAALVPGLVASFLLVASGVYGGFRLARDFSGDPAVVALVQGNRDLGYRWSQKHYGENLEAYLDTTRRLLEESSAQLAIWPENAMTFFVDRRQDYRWTVGAVLAEHGAQLVAGGPRFEEAADSVRYFNSAFLLEVDGEVAAVYDKEQLLPFAEYFPFGSVELLRRNFGRVETIVKGTAIAPLPTAVGRAATMICNEVMFPRLVRARVALGADYLLNLANDGWMRSREFAEHQLCLAALRAVEHRRYLVRSSTSGPSAVVDPHGRIVTRTGVETEADLVAQIEARDGSTVYGRFGDWFAWLALIVVVGAGWARRKRPGGSLLP